MNKKIKIICNPLLMTGGIVFGIVTETLLVLMMFFANGETAKDTIGMYFFNGFCAVGIIIGLLLCSPQWLSVITFDKDTIKFSQAFHRAKYEKYKAFPYIYCADYFHRSIISVGYSAKYIVFSKCRLSDYNLTHINQVQMSEDTIKIRLTKKRKDLLKQILPVNYVKRLNLEQL